MTDNKKNYNYVKFADFQTQWVIDAQNLIFADVKEENIFKMHDQFFNYF